MKDLRKAKAISCGRDGSPFTQIPGQGHTAGAELTTDLKQILLCISHFSTKTKIKHLNKSVKKYGSEYTNGTPTENSGKLPLDTQRILRPGTTDGVLEKYVRGFTYRAWGWSRLTAVHCRSRHDCFMRPGPPNFFMSRQKWQSPHSVRTQARQRRQRVRRRRAPAPGPRLLDDIGGVSNAEGCRQMVVRSERPAKPGLRVSWPQAHCTSDGAELLLLPSKKVSLLVCPEQRATPSRPPTSNIPSCWKEGH